MAACLGLGPLIVGRVLAEVVSEYSYNLGLGNHSLRLGCLQDVLPAIGAFIGGASAALYCSNGPAMMPLWVQYYWMVETIEAARLTFP